MRREGGFRLRRERAADVDALGIWLRPDRADQDLRLSQASPFFTAHLHASFKDVADWLKAAAGPGAPVVGL